MGDVKSGGNVYSAGPRKRFDEKLLRGRIRRVHPVNILKASV